MQGQAVLPALIALESSSSQYYHSTLVPNQSIASLLDVLERFHGKQQPGWPTDPYEFLVWWHCGYPQSEGRCSKGWQKLTAEVGITPEKLLAAKPDKLAAALKPGGMVPELRALRLKEIAMRVQQECGGDLRAALTGLLPKVRGLLKKFPNIADPGADRILLFANLFPVAAVPSNCPHVLVRITRGPERENYGVIYRQAQEALTAEIPEEFTARQRAYLLLKKHGQELCKLTKPKCQLCPVAAGCSYAKRAKTAAARA